LSDTRQLNSCKSASCNYFSSINLTPYHVQLTNCGGLIAVLLGFPCDFPVGPPTELHISSDRFASLVDVLHPHRSADCPPFLSSLVWPLKQRKNVSGLRGYYRQILPLPLQLHLFRKYRPLLSVSFIF